jgi:hypothetical protein
MNLHTHTHTHTHTYHIYEEQLLPDHFNLKSIAPNDFFSFRMITFLFLFLLLNRVETRELRKSQEPFFVG